MEKNGVKKTRKQNHMCSAIITEKVHRDWEEMLKVVDLG